jgi:predicted signal transduction protein with EAL and GGDEF domain/DNA-binding response OmpR family regulator
MKRPDSPQLPARPDPVGPPLVLLVDDDPVGRMLTGAALRERGFEVVEAEGGDAALTWLGQRQPDVVLLDALMPDKDGFDVCQALRQMPRCDALPVLMLTGLDDESSISRAYEAGATDFFVKSYQWTLLAERLRYLLRASRMREELERSRARLAKAQAIARLGSFEYDLRNGMVYGTEEGFSMFGLEVHGKVHDVHEMPMENVIGMMHEEDRERAVEDVRDALRHKRGYSHEFRLRLTDQRIRILHFEAEPEFDQGMIVKFNGVLQDVTERRLAEEKIRQLANYDALTGLPNRRFFLGRCAQALDEARRNGTKTATLFIDLDRFKYINDTLGHAVGDELLCEVARRLRSCVRHRDELFGSSAPPGNQPDRRGASPEGVARLGGDEFTLLLTGLRDEQDADRVAQRLLDGLRQPYILAGQECFVSASVGIAVSPRDGDDVNTLLRNADAAMYAVKARGRNGAGQYSPVLTIAGREQLELASALHKAIERGEIVLFYQPQVDVRTGRIVGVEALMRWQRGSQLVPPSDFIPLAEETGLIIPMGEWAIAEACRQSWIWRQSLGVEFSIAVNVPTRHIQQNSLAAVVSANLRKYELPANAIEIEITETGLMQQLESTVPELEELNAAGVGIAIDDFGTGYSSLSYLTRLPISALKIDRSFVKDLGSKPEAVAVVSAIIALARTLKLQVIAEGVETPAQVDILSDLGCSLMQGFLFSRPLPAAELDNWIRKSDGNLPVVKAPRPALKETGNGRAVA